MHLDIYGSLIIPTNKLISPNDTDSVTVLTLKLSTTHSYMYLGQY